VKGETQMTRVRTLFARAIVIGLLLLTIGGGVANADSSLGQGGASPQALPDDPGYELSQ
jgi:hypothetical protein